MKNVWLAIAILSAVNQIASAGTKQYVGKKVAQPRQVSLDKISHSAWHSLLQKYVDPDGNVDYRKWKATAEDVRILDNYLNHLSSGNPRSQSTKQVRLAYWINAYNSVTVRGMLREYPTTSIRNHTARLIGYNIWKDLLLHVGDSAISLEDIEHKVLRKLQEPRIHFAIVCASRGCPRLLNEAYQAVTMEQQLETNTRDFFGRAQNFRYEPGRRTIYLSSILNWFSEDFGTDQAAMLKTISKWLPTAESRSAAANGKVTASFLKYDWSINEQSAQTAKH